MQISNTARERLTKGLSILFSISLFFLGMEAGYFLKIDRDKPDLVVELQEHPPQAEVLSAQTDTFEEDSSEESKCVYVGSKNSDLYHLPNCAAAKRIKPENKVCFASPEEAQKRGYRPGCLQ